jgi:hypothetical protein
LTCSSAPSLTVEGQTGLMRTIVLGGHAVPDRIVGPIRADVPLLRTIKNLLEPVHFPSHR